MLYHTLMLALVMKVMKDIKKVCTWAYLGVVCPRNSEQEKTWNNKCRPAGGHSSSCDEITEKSACVLHVFVLSDVPWVDTAANTLCRDQMWNGSVMLFSWIRHWPEMSTTENDTEIISLGMYFCVRDVFRDVTTDTTCEELCPHCVRTHSSLFVSVSHHSTRHWHKKHP